MARLRQVCEGFVNVFLLPVGEVFRFNRSLCAVITGAMYRVTPTRRVQVRPYHHRATNARTRPFRYVSTSDNVRRASVRREFFFLQDKGVPHRRRLRRFLHPRVGKVTTRLNRRLIRQDLFLTSFRLTINVPVYFQVTKDQYLFGRLFQFSRDLRDLIVQFVLVISMVRVPLNVGAIAVIRRLRFHDSALVRRLPHAILHTIGVLFGLRMIRGIRVCFLEGIRSNALCGVNAIRRSMWVSHGARQLKIRESGYRIGAELSNGNGHVRRVVFMREQPGKKGQASGLVNRRNSIILVGICVNRNSASDLLRALLKGRLIRSYLPTNNSPLFPTVQELTMVIYNGRLAIKSNRCQPTNGNENVSVVHRGLRLAMGPLLLLRTIRIVSNGDRLFVTIAFPRITFIKQMIVPVLCRLTCGLRYKVVLFLVPFAFQLRRRLVRYVDN